VQLAYCSLTYLNKQTTNNKEENDMATLTSESKIEAKEIGLTIGRLKTKRTVKHWGDIIYEVIEDDVCVREYDCFDNADDAKSEYIQELIIRKMEADDRKEFNASEQSSADAVKQQGNIEMNTLTLNKETMSSLEMGELCNKDHPKVTADIIRILKEVEIDAAEFRAISKDSMNRDRTIYNLPRRECDLVVSGYVAKYRLAIIDRWQELENNQPALPTTYIAALTAHLESEKALQLETEQHEVTKVELVETKIVLDERKEWSSIKRQEVLHQRKFVWQVLTKWHIDHDIDRKEVFDENYGTVKAYHADAWLDVYLIEL